jgi:deazaflavin-dependent oxidoreductase (nitroreductase family)
VRLTIIGGCGAYPGDGQPCGGYLVEHDGFALLLDPGYGVATALSRADAPRFDEVLVSHGHPDHCADLNPLLRARVMAEPRMAPLPVHALPGSLDAVLALDRPEWLEGAIELHEFGAGDRLRIGPFEVATTLLPHPRPNAGVRLSADGATLVYTGDCGPSADLVALAADADVLLAEASYADEVPADLMGSLSSASDAGRQAADARVSRLVLTPLMPGTDTAAARRAARRHFRGPIGVARPGMSMRVRPSPAAPPRGLLKQVLDAPAHLYRAGLGFVLAHRFLMLTSTGRRSGLTRHAVLEVIRYDAERREAIVIAGWGHRTGWLHNLDAGLGMEVRIGRDSFVPAHRLLNAQQAAAAWAAYEHRNRFGAPLVRAVVSRLLGWRYDGSAAARARLVAELPFIALSPADPPAGPRSPSGSRRAPSSTA